jgi:putative SOS response-associated peptidase YedK
MGLVPHWAADPSVGNRTINARAETLTALRSFKSLVNGGCIIAADGFYEYQEANEKVQALEQQLSDFKAQLAVAAKKPALEQNMAQLQ